jgi:hypothetical protein
VAAAIGHGLVLQVAFAALVADRAIERVIDEQELHHALARLLDEFGGGDDFLIVRAGSAQEACGLGGPGFTSTRHIRQLPAMVSRSW